MTASITDETKPDDAYGGSYDPIAALLVHRWFQRGATRRGLCLFERPRQRREPADLGSIEVGGERKQPRRERERERKRRTDEPEVVGRRKPVNSQLPKPNFQRVKTRCLAVGSRRLGVDR
jgi:hypothetical protein